MGNNNVHNKNFYSEPQKQSKFKQKLKKLLPKKNKEKKYKEYDQDETIDEEIIDEINESYYEYDDVEFEYAKRKLHKILNDPIEREKFYKSNELIKLLTLFPYCDWNWRDLSKNPNIDMDYIVKNTKLNWNYVVISFNPNLNIKFVKEFDVYLDWFTVSKNSAIKLQDIISNPKLPWNYKGLSCNPNMRIGYVLKHKKKNWDWYELTKNSGITIADIENNPDLNWKNYSLCDNPNMNINYVKKYYRSPEREDEEKLCWCDLSRNKGILIEDILNNMNLPWVFEEVFYNPNFNLEHLDYMLKNHRNILEQYNSYVQAILHKIEISNKNIKLIELITSNNCRWMTSYTLFDNPHIDFDFILNYRYVINNYKHEEFENCMWFWREISKQISKNPGIKLEKIEQYNNSTQISLWDYSYVSENPNLNYMFVMKYYNKDFSFRRISRNEFDFHPDKDNICFI